MSPETENMWAIDNLKLSMDAGFLFSVFLRMIWKAFLRVI